MPRRSFTSGRKFSTTTSAFSTSRLKAASPCFDFKSRVMLRLLRCRFWKSALSRGPPGPSPFSRCGGVSILMTLAPQSPSWRTQVGPERTRVRSRTVNRERAEEALGNGIVEAPAGEFDPDYAFCGRQSPICRALSIAANGKQGTILFINRRDKRVGRLEKTIEPCHMTRQRMDDPILGVRAACTKLSKTNFAPLIRFS